MVSQLNGTVTKATEGGEWKGGNISKKKKKKKKKKDASYLHLPSLIFFFFFFFLFRNIKPNLKLGNF